MMLNRQVCGKRSIRVKMNYYSSGSFNIDPDTIPVTTSLQVGAEKEYHMKLIKLNRSKVVYLNDHLR